MTGTIGVPDDTGIPQSVRVGAFEYTIRIEDDLKDGSQKLDGWIQHSQTLILLDRSLSAQVMRVTLWHEVLHGIMVQAGHDDVLKDPEIEALAHGIVGVLRDNPWLGALP